METSNYSFIEATCQWLRLANSEPTAEAVNAAIASTKSDDLDALVDVLTDNFDGLSGSPQRFRMLMQAIAARVIQLVQAPGEDEDRQGYLVVTPTTVARLADRLGELDANAAAHALQILAAQGDEESINLLAEMLADSPPQEWKNVAIALSPLWHADAEQLSLFFDRLYEGGLQPSTLTVLLDLAAYSMRAGKLSLHPWQERHSELNSLLASVVARLSVMEREPAKFGSDVAEVQRVLNDSVSLTVSLCDALGLIGNPECEASLLQAMDLSHRRIQAEAAGALVRIGNDKGKKRLVELASDPVARLRAVSYADEFGLAEEIDESLRLPVALAESELAAWLASPDHFGFPPQSLELIDSRTQYWPSYDEPQNCFLFRYTYDFPDNQTLGGQLRNVGIAGPATHAFNADLSQLPTEDIYAAFAGWQAEHEDIFEVPMALLNSAQRREADRLIETLAMQELEVSEAIALTFFLGEVAILANVERAGKPHCAITDGLELICLPTKATPTALTPEILLAIYRGRKLLRTFNPDAT